MIEWMFSSLGHIPISIITLFFDMISGISSHGYNPFALANFAQFYSR